MIQRDKVDRLRIGDELVAEAANSQEMTRFGGLALNVAAEADDEIVDGACVRVLTEIPDVLQDRFAGDGTTGIADQIAEQLRLHQGQLKDLSADAKLEALEVDGFVVEAIYVQ